MTEGHFYLAKADIGIAKCAHSYEKAKFFFSARSAFFLARGHTSGFVFPGNPEVRFPSRAGPLQDFKGAPASTRCAFYNLKRPARKGTKKIVESQ